MREKSKISWKDAHEEAQRLREGSTDAVEEDDEENAANDASQLKNDVSQLHRDMQELLSKDDEEVGIRHEVKRGREAYCRRNLVVKGNQKCYRGN